MGFSGELSKPVSKGVIGIAGFKNSPSAWVSIKFIVIFSFVHSHLKKRDE